MSIRNYSVQEAIAALAEGKVLLMDTDTLPGLHCRADRPEAVARIAELKGRTERKPFLVLAASLQQALLLADPGGEEQRQLLQVCWPGPFSIILPALGAVSEGLTGGTESIGVRVPARGQLCKLIRDAGYPLVSTSVNREHESPSQTLGEAIERFGDRVDGVCRWTDGDADETGDQPLLQPSAVIDARVQPAKVLREGPLPLPEPHDRS